MLSLILLISFHAGAKAYPNASPPSLSCIDTRVRATCALSKVNFSTISDGFAFLTSCVGLTVLVGEGLWPYKRWSSPKILEAFDRTKSFWFLSRERLRLEGESALYTSAEIYCPAEAVDAQLLPNLREQLGGRESLSVGDILVEGQHSYLVDGLHVNKAGYIYATLRDQATGQTIARTLN